MKTDCIELHNRKLVSVTKHWWKILDHYYNIAPITPYRLYTVGKKLLNLKRKNITTSLMRYAVAKKCRVRPCNPLIYLAIFQRLGIESVLDLHPQFGSKALACILGNIKYYYRPADTIPSGMIDIGLDAEIYANQKVDFLLSECDMKKFDISDVKYYLPYAKRVIAYAPSNDKIEIMNRYKPKRLIKLANPFDANYLVVW